jgi:hypothetical protein
LIDIISLSLFVLIRVNSWLKMSRAQNRS